VALKFKLHRTTIVVLCVVGALFASLFATFGYFAERVAHSQDPGEADRVAAQIANFTVPKGFRATIGLDVQIMKQMTISSIDPAKPMTIILQGLAVPASKDAMDTTLAASMKMRCKKLLALGDDLLTANGALLTLHRFSCVGAEGGKATYEFETGSFEGKMPIVAILAFAPEAAWNSAPVHALLRSLH
jgi:hypothetical protein